MRRLRIAALLLAAAPLALSQPPPETPAPAFDIVSVKQVQPDPTKGMVFLGLMNTPDGVNGLAPLSILVRMAYGGNMKFPTDDRVSGLPDWGKTRMYSIAAKMSDDEAEAFNKLSKEDQQKQRQLMLQSLLADRFHLKAHFESRQMPDYELVVAKGGSKLTAAPPGGTPPPDGFKGPDGKPITGSFLRMSGRGKIIAQNFPMDQLASFLTQPVIAVGRPVVDKTGIAGSYNFTLTWMPDLGAAEPTGTEASDSGPSLFTALQEQLGLRLQPATDSFDIIVIDHVDPPTEN